MGTIHYYVDNTIADDTGNDGLSPTSAFSTMFGRISNSTEEVYIWVRRKDFGEISGVVTFPTSTSSGESAVRTISWPNPGDINYDSRPQLGIDAGWDSDSEPRVSITIGIVDDVPLSISRSDIYGFEIIDSTTSQGNHLLAGSNKRMRFYECKISAATLIYYSTTGGVNFSSISMYSCDMTFSGRMYTFDNQSTDETWLGEIVDSTITFTGELDQDWPILYARAEYTSYRFSLQIRNTDIYINRDYAGLARTNYRVVNNSNGGMINSTWDIRVHGAHNADYMIVYAQGFNNCDVSIEGLDGFTFSDMIHIQNASYGQIRNSVFKVKNINMNNMIAASYVISNSKFLAEGCRFADSPFDPAQRVASTAFMELLQCSVNRIYSTGGLLMTECTRNGDEPIFMRAINGSIKAVNCDFSQGASDTGLLHASQGAEVELTNCSTPEAATLIASGSLGKITIWNSSPARWAEYKNTTKVELSQPSRVGSASDGSFMLSYYAPGIYQVASLGNGVDFGLETEIASNTSFIDIFCISLAAEIPDKEMLTSALVSEDMIFTDFEVLADASNWNDVSGGSPFKIRISTDVLRTQKAIASISVSIHEIESSIYVDPVIVPGI